MDENNSNPINEFQFIEARGSWNTKYVDPNGFVCQVTLRAETGKELMDKVKGAISYLLENECVPYANNYGSYRNNNNKVTTTEDKDGPSNGNHQSDNPGWCSIHQVQMKQRSKDGKTWFSHKTPEGWCSGMVKETK